MKPTRNLLFGMILVSFSLTGCGPARGGEQQYLEIHHSAAAVLPAAVEIETQYGSADHFITHYGMGSADVNTWNTEVFFGGRYSLAMQAPIKVDYGKRKVSVAGKAEFYMFEYTEIAINGGCSVGENYHFSESDWKKVFQAKGDFSVIGIKLNPKPVPNFDKLVEATRRPRIPISLMKLEPPSNHSEK